MKKFIYFVVLTLCMCQFGLAQQKSRFGQLQRVEDSIFIVEEGKRYIADQNVVTVKLKPEINKIRESLQVLCSNKLGYINISVPIGVDIEDFVSMLDETGEFEVVEYNSFGEYHIIPTDTRISEQWYLNSINAFSAWDINMGSPNIVVAILDSGVDWMHPDLGNGTDGYKNIDETLGWNFELNNNNVITTNHHGTMVAGIIGAKTNNARGIAGITGGYNSRGVTIIPTCIGANGVIGAIIADAIIYAVDNKAKVINMSFGVPRTHAIDAAIYYAVQNNVVLVSASGNDGSSVVSYPASHNDVIAVGAVNSKKKRWLYSTYGNNLDVVAPGVGILSTTLKNDYISQDGTSFAAPQVAGIAALIFSINPILKGRDVRNIIESTAQKVGGYKYKTEAGHNNGTWHEQMGYGLVNAYEAVQAAVACKTTIVNFNGTVTNPVIVTSDTTVISCGDINVEYVKVQSGANLTLDATGNIKVQNITITNNSKLTLEAAGKVKLGVGLKVEIGSKLEIK